MTKKYKTPNAFKQALKARIKRRARKTGRGFNRMLQIVLFERFLARVYEALGEAVILKGGFAMELRLRRARTTKDIDLRVEGELDELVEELREAAAKQGDDYLTFDLGEPTEFEEMLGDQVVYGGCRITVQPMLAGKAFGGGFRLDLSVADRVLLPSDRVEGTDLLEFAGLDRLEHRIYPEEAHAAEKLHALTMEYEEGPNSRVKDLVDVGLLATHTEFEAADLRASIEATFEFRDTHELPTQLPDPPDFWDSMYDEMQSEDDLPWATLDELHSSCATFLNPLLDQRLDDGDHWSPDEQNWGKGEG
ncbi:MAG: nucleotidyl transferase AbiEii/AbiGii toxin family protein [Persicimonas sp.]